MKIKRPFTLPPFSKKAEAPTPVVECRTYVDELGRTVKVLPPMWGEGMDAKYTAKPKGRRKKTDP